MYRANENTEGVAMYDLEPTAAVALTRGALCRCPRCGEGRLFGKFLKVVDVCDVCGEELYHQRADDMPAYIVMTIVGHIIIGLMLWVEVRYSPPFWVHAALWFPLTIVLSSRSAATGQGDDRSHAVAFRDARVRTEQTLAAYHSCKDVLKKALVSHGASTSPSCTAREV